MTWKEDVATGVLPRVRDAVPAHDVLAVAFDFVNCLVRVCVPEATPEGTRDAIENAARAVAPVGAYVVGPPEYPFTLHLSGPTHPVRQPRQRDGVAQIELQADDLRHLRSAYETLATECGDADGVATFAMGGVPAMQFVTRLAREDYADDDAVAHAVQAGRRKFHVFPGLLWTDDGRNVPVFTRWLEGLRPDARVLVFDTTFSGGAVGRIKNAIEAWAPGARPACARKTHL